MSPILPTTSPYVGDHPRGSLPPSPPSSTTTGTPPRGLHHEH